jgi:glucose-1-phosphate adenylyltransferase
VGRVINSVISNGVIVCGGLVHNSVLSPRVGVGRCARLNRAVILHNSRVGRRAVVENAILDKRVIVADGAMTGWTRSTKGPRFRGVQRHHRGR